MNFVHKNKNYIQKIQNEIDNYNKEELDEDAGKPIQSAEDEALSSESRVEYMKLLHLCPEPFREVLYLRIFGTLSFKEIGEIMGKTENWARVTYYRGKEKLRKDMSEDEK